jgi:hypothetical protein
VNDLAQYDLTTWNLWPLGVGLSGFPSGCIGGLYFGEQIMDKKTIKAILDKCDEYRGSPETDEDGFYQNVHALLTQLTNGEDVSYIKIEGGLVYLVPDGIIKYNEQVGNNWQKDRDTIKRLEKQLKEMQEYSCFVKDESGHLCSIAEKNQELEKQIHALKEVLFCCGEVAVNSFDDIVVGLVDKTLEGFEIPMSRYREILNTLTKSTPLRRNGPDGTDANSEQQNQRPAH